MLILAPFFGLAQQNHVFSGQVRDSETRECLSGVFVSLFSQSKVLGYSITDGNGIYSISFNKDVKPDTLRASLIGYASYTAALIQSPNNDIALKPRKTELKSSKVTASAIEKQGDTTRYLAKAFSDGTEKNLGDLLSKIPGLEVTESGGLVSDGKSISKFYVDGLDLMGSQYGTIVKNLTPDNIASVEVYKRHQPIKALLGISQSDRNAVNIVLKESARGTWLFTGNMAYGVPEFPLFDARALVTRFAPSRQNLFLMKGNNIGKDIIQELREQEYFGRKAGAYLVSEDADSDFSTPLNPSFSRLKLPKETWYDNTTATACFNDLKKTASCLLVRTSLSAARENYSEQMSQSETVLFKDGGSIIIEEQSTLDDIRSFLKGKIQVERNDSTKFFSDEVLFSGQSRDNKSFIARNAMDVSQDYTLPAFKIKNSLSSIKRLSQGKTLSFDSETMIVSNNDRADYNVSGSRFFQVYKDSFLDSRNQAGFGLRIGRQTFNVKARTDVVGGNLNSVLSGLDAGSVCLSSQKVIWHIASGLSASTNRQIGKSRLSVSFPASLNYMSSGIGRPVFYPSFYPSLTMDGPVSGNLDYNIRSSYSLSRSRFESLLGSAIATTYRTLSVPDSLRLSRNLTFTAGLTYSDNVAMVFSSLNAFFMRSGSDKAPSSFYSEDYSMTRFIPQEITNDTYGLTATLKKYFGLRTLVAEIHSGLHQSNQSGFLQGFDVDYRNRSIEGGLTIRSNPCDWFSGELNTDLGVSQTSGSASMVTRNAVNRLTLIVKPVNPLSIQADYYQSWYGSRVFTVSNDPILNFVVECKFKTFSVFSRVVNLLDVDGYTMESMSIYHSYSLTRKLLGRRFLVGIQMSL